MKKLILSLTLAAFAIGVQAGEGKDSKEAKDKPACTDKAKAGCQAKSSCCATKSACAKGQPEKQALLSPKAAGN